MRSTRLVSTLALVTAVVLFGALSTMAVAGDKCCAQDSAKSEECHDGKKPEDVYSGGVANAHHAIAVLEALESGDASALEKLISANTYVQHNLAFPSGRDAMVGAVSSGMLDGTTVDVKRAFSDGEYVVTHSEYTLFGQHQVGFDVFRFEDGLVVEHWDNLQPFAEPNPSGHTMLDGPVDVGDVELTAGNKALIERFVSGVLIGGDFDSLPGYFDGDSYAQHNPGIGDDLSTLVDAIVSGAVTMTFEKLHFVLGSGDFVLAISIPALDRQSQFYRNTRAGERQPRPDNSKELAPGLSARRIVNGLYVLFLCRSPIPDSAPDGGRPLYLSIVRIATGRSDPW